MSLTFQIDGSGDIVVSAGRLVLVDSTAQRVTTRLRMLLGEWFLDKNDGTPYLQQILIADPQVPHIRSALQDRILGTEGVTGIQSLDLAIDRVRRKLGVTASVFGPSGQPFTVQV